MPAREAHWVEESRKLNPTWKVKCFGNEVLERFGQDPYVKAMTLRNRPKAFITDRIRVLLLLEEGGVWLDPDCQHIRPLDTLSPIWDDPKVDFVMSGRNPYRARVALSRGINIFDNTFIASAPQGRILRRISALWRPELMTGTNVIDGGCCGREAFASLDGITDRVIGYRAFYDMESGPQTIVLHDSHNLGSWTAQLQQERMATHA